MKRPLIFLAIVVLTSAAVLLVLKNQPRTYQSTAEIVFGSSEVNAVNGKQLPVKAVVSEAGCHAIKRAIVESEKSDAKVHFNEIKLTDIELKSIQEDVWEVTGTYSAAVAKSRSRWKAVLNLVHHGDTLLYSPTEIWSGNDFDQLEWKKE